MVEFEEIEFESLKDYVVLGFGGDSELLERYQQLDTDFDATVSRNMSYITDSMEGKKFIFYRIMWEERPIGFTVLDVTDSFLFSFGINKQFRSWEILNEWWAYILMMFDGDFGCILWAKNSRAINFLTRQGMQVMEQPDNKIVLLINNN